MNTCSFTFIPWDSSCFLLTILPHNCDLLKRKRKREREAPVWIRCCGNDGPQQCRRRRVLDSYRSGNVTHPSDTTFRQRQLSGGKTRPWPWCVKYRFHVECTGWINEAGPVQLQQVAEGLTRLYFSGLDAGEEWCAFSLSAATVHSCVMLSLIHEA